MECDAWVLGLRLHGVSMCLHEPGLEILLEGARFQRRKRTTAGASTGAKWSSSVERLLIVRVIEAGRCTQNLAFLFLAQNPKKMKRTTTCPT